MTAPRKVKVFKTVAEFIPGELCFLPDELTFAKRLASVRDPEESREFWRVLIERKLADPTYTIFQDFPRETPPEPEPEINENPLALSIPDGIKKPEYRGDVAAFVGEQIRYLKEIGRIKK